MLHRGLQPDHVQVVGKGDMIDTLRVNGWSLLMFCIVRRIE